MGIENASGEACWGLERPGQWSEGRRELKWAVKKVSGGAWRAADPVRPARNRASRGQLRAFLSIYSVADLLSLLICLLAK